MGATGVARRAWHDERGAMSAARGILALAAVTTVALLSLHTQRRQSAPTQCLAGAASGYAVSADAKLFAALRAWYCAR